MPTLMSIYSAEVTMYKGVARIFSRESKEYFFGFPGGQIPDMDPFGCMVKKKEKCASQGGSADHTGKPLGGGEVFLCIFF